MNVHHITRDPGSDAKLLVLNGEILMTHEESGEPIFPSEAGPQLNAAIYDHIQMFEGIADGDAVMLDGQFLGFRDDVHFKPLLHQPEDGTLIYTLGNPKVYEPYIRSSSVAAKAPGGTVWRTLAEAQAGLAQVEQPWKLYGVKASWADTQEDADQPEGARSLAGTGILTLLPSTPEVPRWTLELYGSGTVIVTSNLPSRPHLHIGHVPGDAAGAELRQQVGQELEVWLNGGPVSELFRGVQRLHPEGIVLRNGCGVAAVGPMVDDAAHPQWGLWKMDDSAEAKQARIALIDRVAADTKTDLAPEPAGA